MGGKPLMVLTNLKMENTEDALKIMEIIYLQGGSVRKLLFFTPLTIDKKSDFILLRITINEESMKSEILEKVILIVSRPANPYGRRPSHFTVLLANSNIIVVSVLNWLIVFKYKP